MADRYPDRPAVIHNGNILTYAELRAAVRERARQLGPRPGVVAVPTSRSPETIVSLFGVWAAGGTYCPIDPAFPRDRQDMMRSAAGCDAGGDADNDPDPPAYILFTSGSTGRPKPVTTPRRAIATTVESLRGLFALCESDRVLQFSSLNWDTCFEEILPALSGGAALVFDDDAHTGSFRRFLRAVERQRISILDLPTAFWHELVNHLREERVELPGCLRLVVIGGEAVNPARLAEWRALPTGHLRLLNTYGCTETTLITHAVDLHGPLAAPAPAGVAAGMASTAAEGTTTVAATAGTTTVAATAGTTTVAAAGTTAAADPPRIAAATTALATVDAPDTAGATTDPVVGPAPIGRALPHVVERIGPDGELLIGGPAIASGYRGLPEATRDRFVELAGERFFRTGDRVRRGPGGLLFPEGRLDAEVKIRGIRVDPAEVEAHIGACPGVGAVAVAPSTLAGRTALVAYLVPLQTADGATLGRRVTDFLRQRVPGHLIPSRIRVVPHLVYTATGKVDRQGSKEFFDGC
ncbi:AMP-binding protein [Plantactinospora siamensis]|uniref:AMP-binding protein n=1 Tax=Plantactinospora siamensis TaxID=555372 RepID=A0ABV6NY89_9ACTN